MNKNSNRLNRIDEELKKEISSIIMNDLQNSNITGMISVTSAKITPDLRYAQVYVSILNSKNTKATFDALQRASGYIRGEIARRINLRVTPQIVFKLDNSIEYGERIDKILKEILPEKPTKNEE